MDGWKLILSFPFGSANVQFRGAVQLQGVLWIRFGQQHFAQISGLTVSGPPKRRIVGELTIPDLPSWQPGDVLYFEEKNLQKKAQTSSKTRVIWVLGSYPHGFFVVASFWKGLFFFSRCFFSDLQEGLRLVKDVDIDQPFSMQDGDFTLSNRFRETKYEVNK